MSESLQEWVALLFVLIVGIGFIVARRRRRRRLQTRTIKWVKRS
jgi:LPXTG-motif cell wall-anchored protein